MTSDADRTDRKTGRPGDRRHPAYEFVERGGRPTLVLRSFSLASALLRLKEGTRQAGFSADVVLAGPLRPPMLYVEGAAHREQRRLAAVFFTPKAVATKHRQTIVTLADELVTDLERRGEGRLDLVSFRLAMRVVCEVVGLTDSDIGAMERLLDRYFQTPPPPDAPRLSRLRRRVLEQVITARFYLHHVRPAVRARRANPRDDVISRLIAQGLRDRDLLVECVTYAAAGMVTTRQFISVAAWHLLERPDLRARFVAGSDDERRRVLQEIIRLDSIAGHLLRTATTDLTLDAADGAIHIPQGTLIDLELGAANTDEPVFGSHPLLLDPDRQIATEAGPSGLAFGAGHHSCPGEYLALEETDLFLQRFLRSEWTLVGTPTIGWNDIVLAFDISDLVVRRVS